MSFNPFIHDSAFRGSPILSYGRAPSGTVWPKILAILAGILVVMGITGGIWFWFFSNVPTPINTAVRIILPANKLLTTKAPLEWKQVQELNKPMPTIAGMVNNKNTGEFEAYAIRLSPIEAIFSDKKVWHIQTKAKELNLEYQTPYMIFGWPWELINQEIWLDLDLKQVFSYKNVFLDDLPGKVSGPLVANEWKTDLRVFEEFDDLNFMLQSQGIDGFAPILSINESILQNYHNYNGINIDSAGENSAFGWKFINGQAESGLFGAGGGGLLVGTSTVIDGYSTTKDFVLPDGDVVRRVFLLDEVDDSISDIENEEIIQTDIFERTDNTVNDLTCPGIVLAKLDATSVMNLCSWIDICFVSWNKLLFVNRDGYLVVCGY